MIKHPLDLLAWKKKMRIYSHPNLHLNANVLGLAQNHGNEEHYSSGASILWICLLPSQERCDLPIQRLGEDWWAQWSCIPNPPLCVHSGCLALSPRMLAWWWIRLQAGTSLAPAQPMQGDTGASPHFGQSCCLLPKVSPRQRSPRAAVPPKQLSQIKPIHTTLGPHLHLLPALILHPPPSSSATPAPSTFLQVITKDIN